MSTTLRDDVSKDIFNVPNQVTAARLALAIAVFVLIPLGWYLAAVVVFVIAASTDWVDGYWARKYNQVTQFGRVFDPFVDKIIICGVFIFLAAEPLSGIHAWMAVVVSGREMLVTVLRSFIEQHGGDFSATMPGKIKMVLQCAAVVASLVALMHLTDAAPAPPVTDAAATTNAAATTLADLPTWLFWTLHSLVWLAVLSTIYSGAVYLAAAAKFFVPSRS